VGEACSAVNRRYYTVEQMNDYGTYHPGEGETNYYPQISRWYIPSFDEMAFIAKQCKNIDFVNNTTLQQRILQYNIDYPWTNAGFTFPNGIASVGVKIGEELLGANGYVWTSTGSFDVGNTAEYIQATGGAPTANSGIECKQFTKAWAFDFSQLQLNSGESGTIKIKKLHDFNDRAELRLVRMIRCDQRYYDNNSPEKLKNTVWSVPRITENAICNGTGRATNSGEFIPYRSGTIQIQTYPNNLEGTPTIFNDG